MTTDRSTACLDWADRLRTGRSIIPAPIFPDEAEAGLTVMRELKIVDAPGSPTIGEACAPWVFDLAASIFGAYEAETGRRLITEWFVCLPKKNSKSTIAAAIMITALIRNWRQSAEFIILAPTVEIASNSYAPSRDMVQKDDELDALMNVQTHVKTITHRESGASLKVVAADSSTVGGKKAVGVLIDEAWLFGKVADAENMLREATGGLASRPEGFIIWLSTQSDDPPAGVFKQKLQYARDVRDGKIYDPQFVPVIYEFPEEMIKAGEHRNPANFGMVNPNIGYSVDRAFLERELRKAQNDGEESMRGFLAKHLNVEIGLSLRGDRWAGADFWEAAADPELSKLKGRAALAAMLERCEVAVAGGDGGGLDDLLGLSIAGREKVATEVMEPEYTDDLGTLIPARKVMRKRWLVWHHAWAHRIVLERRKDIAPRLLDLQAAGCLTIVELPGQDVQQVADCIEMIRAAGLMPDKNAIGVDAAGIADIVDELGTREFNIEPGGHVVAISQGWRLNGAIKTTERKLAGGQLLHCGVLLMAWCVGNAKVDDKGNAVAITKQISGKAKIDPLMATFNAVSLLALNPIAMIIGEDYEMVTA